MQKLILDQISIDDLVSRLAVKVVDILQDSPIEPGLRGQLLEVERTIIIKTLAKAGNNISEASRILGVDRASLSKKIKAHGIDLSN